MKKTHLLAVILALFTVIAAVAMLQGCEVKGNASCDGCNSCSDSDVFSSCAACIDVSSCVSGCDGCNSCSKEEEAAPEDGTIDRQTEDEGVTPIPDDLATEPVTEPTTTTTTAPQVVSPADQPINITVNINGVNLDNETTTTEEPTTTTTAEATTTSAEVPTTILEPETTSTVAISLPTKPDGTAFIPGTKADLPMLSLLDGPTMGVPDGKVLAVGSRATREDTIIAICNPAGTTITLLCHKDTLPAEIRAVADCYPTRNINVYRTERECFVWLRGNSSYAVHNGSDAVRIDPSLEKPSWITGETSALTTDALSDLQAKIDNARQYSGTRDGFVIVATDIDILRYFWGKKSPAYKHVGPQYFQPILRNDGATTSDSDVPAAASAEDNAPVAETAPVSGSDAPAVNVNVELPLLSLVSGESLGLDDGMALAVGARGLREDAIIAVANPKGSTVLLYCHAGTTNKQLNRVAALYPDRRPLVYRMGRESFIWLREGASYAVYDAESTVAVDPALEAPSWVTGANAMSDEALTTVKAKYEESARYSGTREGFVIVADDDDILRYNYGKRVG